MREFSIVAVCSYSVHKYHRECAKTHFVVRNTKLFWGRGPPVPLSDGLDTHPCKILDPPLYNYGRLKSSASHASRENTLLKCGKIQKCSRHLQRRFADGRTDGAYLGGRRCVGRVHSVVYNASAVTRGAGHMLSE